MSLDWGFVWEILWGIQYGMKYTSRMNDRLRLLAVLIDKSFTVGLRMGGKPWNNQCL